jgi:Transport protein particle (TRAPP) component
VSLSAFCLLYSEIIQYHQNRVDSISELERRLECTGYTVGLRVLELLAYRNRDYKRETRLMGVLQFVSTQVWKALFGKAADSLERSIDHADEFMIVDYAPITRYVCLLVYAAEQALHGCLTVLLHLLSTCRWLPCSWLVTACFQSTLSSFCVFF